MNRTIGFLLFTLSLSQLALASNSHAAKTIYEGRLNGKTLELIYEYEAEDMTYFVQAPTFGSDDSPTPPAPVWSVSLSGGQVYFNYDGYFASGPLTDGAQMQSRSEWRLISHLAYESCPDGKIRGSLTFSDNTFVQTLVGNNVITLGAGPLQSMQINVEHKRIESVDFPASRNVLVNGQPFTLTLKSAN